MKKYDVCGFGNAIVDLLFECSEQQFQKLNMTKGGMRLIDAATQSQVLSILGQPVRMASGGSVANSLALIGQLGGRALMCCSLADDSYGRFFQNDLAEMGVDTFTGKNGCSSEACGSTAQTGTSLVVVTPDAERSMSTSLGAAMDLNLSHVDQQKISDSKWFFIEGYAVANGQAAQQAISEAIDVARKNHVRVAITLSDAFVVNSFRDFLNIILPRVDLIFCNEKEAQALCGEPDPEKAFEKLRPDYAGLVVTAGADGAYVSLDSKIGHAAAFACKPVDLTGAGDAFAGAFLHGLCSNFSPQESAHHGCFYAGKVIQQWGARLRADMDKLRLELQG